MSRFPSLSGKDAVRVLEQFGFTVRRQHGSHVVLAKGTRRAVVPLHDELARGTVASILKSAGISVDQLRELM